MNRYLKYIGIGILFILPGEFLANIITFQKPLSDYGAALVLYVVLLSVGYGFWHVSRRIRHRGLAFLVALFFFGTTGLMAEWFIIGNTPWQNPHAFQLGMFSWWASVFMVPRLFLENNSYQRLKHWAIGCYFLLSGALLFLSKLPPVLGSLLFGGGLVSFLIVDIWYVVIKLKKE